MTDGLPRTYVYIDGFNLYYRCLKNTPNKWLDVEGFCKSLLSTGTPLLSIKYFTANIKAKTNSFNAADRQGIYLKAIAHHCSTVEIIRGEYQVTIKKRKLAKKLPCQQETPCHESELIQVHLPEEKQTDVNIASHMINDAWLDKYDQALLISSDTDLTTALEIVHTDYQGKPKKRIGLAGCNPKTKAPGSLIKHSDWYKTITPELLNSNQMPDSISPNLRKPDSWYFENHVAYSDRT